LLLVVMNTLHEFAHAAACKHFGGKVERIGLMFMYLHPVPYCDVSDSWRFANSNHRIAVAASGIFFQTVLSTLALSAWMVTGWSVLAAFAGVSLALAVFNFFPLVKLDGYWMLVHALREPNLKQKALGSVDQLLRRALSRERGPRRPLRPVLVAFGAGHVLSVPLFWALGLTGLYRYGSKLSPLLAALLVALFAAPLLYRAAKAGFLYLQSLQLTPQKAVAQ